jgi:methionyl-tRNA formyltransferase
MRVVFAGTGDISLPTLEMLLASRHEVIGVVTNPDKPVGRHQQLHPPAVKTRAQAVGVPVIQPARIREPAALEQLRAWAPDVMVVMAYGHILPPAVLAVPRVACLNLHASLLPRHRGAAPIQAAIAAGDRETGMTVMFMDEGMDTGDILLKKSIAIRRRETGGTLHDRLAVLAPSALAEALALLADGKAPRTLQEAASATHAAKLHRDSGRIDWAASAVVIERNIRAMNPWPGAFTDWPATGEGGAQRLKVFSAIVCRKSAGPPAQVLRADDAGLLVAAGEGALLLREVQLEGRKRMTAGEFVRGHRPEPGLRLGGTA